MIDRLVTDFPTRIPNDRNRLASFDVEADVVHGFRHPPTHLEMGA